nr:glycosyltransferase [Actinomycetospora soli]
MVHIHFAVDAAGLLPALCRRRRPFVVSLHGHDVLSSDSTLRGRGYRGRTLLARREELIDRTSLFLCSSKYLRDEAISRGYPPSRTFVHYVGHSLGENDRAGEESPGPAKVLFVGRLVENKGVDLIVPVSQSLSAMGVDHRIDVVGAGPFLTELRRQISLAGAAVDVHEPMPQARVHALMRRAHLVIVPSRPIGSGESEALNLVALEAGAIGIPVVANATGGIPEVVMDGVTGLLADPTQPSDFLDKVTRVLSDGEMRSAMRGNGETLSHFSKKFRRSALMDFYERLL